MSDYAGDPRRAGAPQARGLSARGALSTPAPTRPRVALMTVLVAAAMPVRVSASLPIVNSISILDILLVVAALTLLLDLAYRPLEVGYRDVFLILCLPLILTIVSLVWSQDREATARSAIILAEGVVAFLFVVRELDGLSSDRVITYIKRYAYLLIIPAVLLLLRVPGFEPQEEGISRTSGYFISYYTRLSHPILGRSNNLAIVLAFVAPLLFYWGHVRNDRRIMRAAIASLLAIFLTLSRGTLLAFLLAGLIYWLLTLGSSESRRARGLSRKVGVAGAFGVAAIGVFYILNPATQEFFRDRLTLANVTDRLDLLSHGYDKVMGRPLLGYGGGVTPDGDPLLQGGVHNTYLQQAISFGLPVGFLVSVALCGLALAFLARRRVTPLAGVIAYTVLVQLVSFLYESSFEGTVLRVLFYLSIGLAVGLLRSVQAETEPRLAGEG